MKIGIDIDDTLVDTSESFNNVVKKYNLDFKKSFKEDWTEEEKNFIFSNYLKEILLNAKIKEGSIEVINYLLSKGNDIVIITARGNRHCKNIEKLTEKQIKKHINIEKFYFNQDKKSDLAKQMNLDLMIDDSIFVYNNMKQEKFDCILFGDKINNWHDVLAYMKQKEKKWKE